MSLIRKWLPQGAEITEKLNQTSSLAMMESFGKGEGLDHLRVQQGSSLIGKRVDETELGSKYDATVYAVRKEDESIKMISGEDVIEPNDTLIIQALPESIEQITRDKGVESVEVTPKVRQRILWEYGTAEILIHPESGLVGQSIRQLSFQSHYGLRVMGVRRKQTVIENYLDKALEEGCNLLICGPWQRIQDLRELNHDFVVTKVSSDHADVVPAYRKLPFALAILGLMVVLSAFEIVPLVVAVLSAALLAVFTRCLDMDQGYRAIHWNSIVLMAGMLPLADALQQTGLADLAVDGLMGAVGDADPRVMFTILFFLTAALGLFLSNTASAVLVAPIAIVAAKGLDVSPYPFCIAVLISASAAFMTPVSTPVVTLVVQPGNYRFMDFIRIGTPLLIIVYLVTLLTAPLLFPY
jgi:di/tricarboxylate transporter